MERLPSLAFPDRVFDRFCVTAVRHILDGLQRGHEAQVTGRSALRRQRTKPLDEAGRNLGSLHA